MKSDRRIPRRIPRRTVLKGLGTAVALPFFESMSPALRKTLEDNLI